MTVGPWKPINLHTYNVYLADVDVRNKVSEALDVKVTVDLTLSEKSSGSASVTLKNAQGEVVHTENNLKVDSGSARAEFKFSTGELELWYPVHYGKQPLYTVEVTVSDAVSTDVPPLPLKNLIHLLDHYCRTARQLTLRPRKSRSVVSVWLKSLSSINQGKLSCLKSTTSGSSVADRTGFLLIHF